MNRTDADDERDVVEKAAPVDGPVIAGPGPDADADAPDADGLTLKQKFYKVLDGVNKARDQALEVISIIEANPDVDFRKVVESCQRFGIIRTNPFG